MSSSAPLAETAKTSVPPPAAGADADASTGTDAGTGAHDRQAIREVWKNVAGYLAVVVVTLAVLACALRLWRADLSVPLVYQGDSLFNQMLIQGMSENGWYLGNSRLGMPWPQNLHDFPMADSLHLAILKMLTWVIHDAGLVLNLYSLLCFPLVALSAYFVLRRFRLSRLTALVPSVLFACAPYHFCRYSTHLFLSAYYLLPLMTLLLVRLYLGRLPFVRPDSRGGAARWRFLDWESAGAVLICAMTGIAGAYYAFFSCFLLLAGGIKASFRDRKWTPLAAAALLIAVICAAAGASLAPTFFYIIGHGKNREVAARLDMEADLYGLNVAEMLLPVVTHHWRALARIHAAYDASPRQTTGEHLAVSLGFLASLGFLWLVGRFLWRRRDKTDRVEDGLAYLTVAAVMLATIGGLGSLFSFYVSPMIRCYNRICIWIAFFALFGLAAQSHRLVRRHVAGKSKTVFAFYALSAVGLLLLSCWDQTVHLFIPKYEVMKRKYHSDDDFGKRMEAALPSGAMVYQMPFVSFPENPPVFALKDYELLRPYLHTRTLRFSYGAMRGREASRWQEALSLRPLPEAVRTLAFAGFEGIYLDRAGFADGGAAVEKQLSRMLGVEPLASLDKQQLCYDMSKYIRELRRWHDDSEWQRERYDAFHPIIMTWPMYGAEEEDIKRGSFRWSGPTCELRIVNHNERPRDVVMRMALSGWSNSPARLIIDGDLARDELRITEDPRPLELKLHLPPGKHLLRFTCDGPVLRPRGDPRFIVFRLWNFNWSVLKQPRE